MMPAHASMPIVELERLLCQEVGCRVATVERAPVLGPFRMCIRCGRWER